MDEDFKCQPRTVNYRVESMLKEANVIAEAEWGKAVMERRLG